MATRMIHCIGTEGSPAIALGMVVVTLLEALCDVLELESPAPFGAVLTANILPWFVRI